MSKKIIAVVLVTYNGEDWIDTCILPLYNVEGVELIIVDNCSTDKTVEKLKQKYPEIKLIESEKNLGFGKANNLGFEYAIANDFENVFFKNVKLIKWNIDTYIEEINQFSVGLMPLNNSNWEKGKCSYKMLQYMACFKPVIVSPIGMNLDILEEFNCGLAASDDFSWYNNLQILFDDKELQKQFGYNGRKAVEHNFSLKNNFKVISKIFNDYVSN